MSVKRICDRCGKDITRILVHTSISVYSLSTKNYDLCNHCYVELLDWLKEKKVPYYKEKENERS